MHPYMAFVGEPREGAALVFAETARKAKALAWRRVGWLDCDYIDLRVTRMREHELYLMSLRDFGDVLDDPPTCPICETWGAPPNDDGNGCDNCGGDDLPPNT